MSDAFLPLDADFWNDDRTRYTVFFDPGRVKRGILPNRQMGRLEAGSGPRWSSNGTGGTDMGCRSRRNSDTSFRPLRHRAAARHGGVEGDTAGGGDARAGGGDVPGSAGSWPASASTRRREERRARHARVKVAIEKTAKRAGATPRPVAGGRLRLVAFAFLEDLAGNRVGRAFEVDNFERTDIQYANRAADLTFKIGP